MVWFWLIFGREGSFVKCYVLMSFYVEIKEKETNDLGYGSTLGGFSSTGIKVDVDY